jgi:hypothetical protein
MRMRVIFPILIFSGSTLFSLAVSLVVTWFVWEATIYERAFHCTDDGLDIAFWMSADTHESAGDIIQPGWTWDEVRTVNRMFMISFYALGLGGGWLLFRILYRKDEIP